MNDTTMKNLRRVTVPVLAIIVSLTLVGLAFGAEQEMVSKRYTLEHKPLTDAAVEIGNLLGEDGTVSMQPGRSALMVQDTAAVQRKVERFLGDFDRPPRPVEIAVSLMLASDTRREEAGRHAPMNALSAEVRGVMESVGDFTRWIDYEPLGKHDGASTEGQLVSARLDDTYGVEYKVDRIDTESAGTRVRLSPFRLIRYRLNEEGEAVAETVFETSMSLPNGRTQVLGAASGAAAERALFITVQVQVVD